MKKHAPATLRNRDAIADVLARELPERGTVLEVASGSGEHAVFFAEHFPNLIWLPSDADPAAVASIASYRADYSGSNLREPVLLDAALGAGLPDVSAMLCINMVHISPWPATTGLFEGAAHALREGEPLIFYGPYFERGVPPAPSNLNFNTSLRAQDERWGIRNIDDMDALASRHGFERTARHEMPANNLTLVYRRG